METYKNNSCGIFFFTLLKILLISKGFQKSKILGQSQWVSLSKGGGTDGVFQGLAGLPALGKPCTSPTLFAIGFTVINRPGVARAVL